MTGSTPNINIPYVPENTLDPAAGLNLALNFIDALLQTAVISMDQTVPPATGADGDLYIVANGATGVWAGQDGNLARFVDEGNSWQFFVAGVEVHYVLNKDDGGLYKFIDGSPAGNWTLAAGLSDAPNDGNAYFRRSMAWDQYFPVQVENEDSPPTIEPEVFRLVFVGAMLEVLTGGVVRVIIPDVGTSSVLTSETESALPNARRLDAGDDMEFDDSVPGVRTVDVKRVPNKQWLNVDAAAPAGIGASALTVVGTASTPAKATGGTTIRGYWGKRRQASTTAANNVASFRCSNAQDECYAGVGGSTPPQAAGFRFSIRFSPSTIVAGERFFCGMAPNAAEAGTADPSALLNCLGVAKDGADTNMFFIHNDGSGAATKVDLGFAFIDRAFELELLVPVGGGSCRYRLTNLDTNVVYSGTVNTNLPANDAPLFWRLWSSVGAVAGTAVTVDFHSADLRYPL